MFMQIAVRDIGQLTDLYGMSDTPSAARELGVERVPLETGA
jgi:hypothetical protein